MHFMYILTFLFFFYVFRILIFLVLFHFIYPANALESSNKLFDFEWIIVQIRANYNWSIPLEIPFFMDWFMIEL